MDAFEPKLEWVPQLGLPVLRGERDLCPYLPDRESEQVYLVGTAPGAREYRALLDQRFRRNGLVYYRPDCPTCRACVPIRVVVARFRPSRSQRRVARRNADVDVCCGPPSVDDEHFALFREYQAIVHPEDPQYDRALFAQFLGASLIPTFELRFRCAGRLVGVSVVDACGDALSSVYCYYDPQEARRSLGVFTGLAEIEECRRRGLRYWYLGYHVAGCRKMEYKSRFRPHELLGADGVWREAGDA